MEVNVLVTLQVDTGELDTVRSPAGALAVRTSVLQAVEGAVRHYEEQGFSHPLADKVSIGVAAVELYFGREVDK